MASMSRISEVGQRSCKSIGIDYAFITAKMYNNRISVERSRAISLIIDPGDEIEVVRVRRIKKAYGGVFTGIVSTLL